MAKYERRNENVVDAFRFDSLDVDKARDLPKWFLTLIAQDRVYQEDAETIKICDIGKATTQKVWLTAKRGDWIVMSRFDYLYVMSDEEFHRKFKRVEE